MNAICIDCRAPIMRMTVGRGRPRVRCESCSPEQRKPPGAYVGLNVKSRPRPETCPHCKTAFVATFILQRHCSEKCRVDHSNAKQYAKLAELSAVWRSEERACRHCGERFAPVARHQVYCSARCLGQRPEKQGKAHIRRALRFGCVIESFDKIAIFERDGWTCRSCGIDTPQSLMGKRAHNAPELDHVIPLSRGGAHSAVNAQCLCHECNRRKGSKTPDEFALALAA